MASMDYHRLSKYYTYHEEPFATENSITKSSWKLLSKAVLDKLCCMEYRYSLKSPILKGLMINSV